MFYQLLVGSWPAELLSHSAPDAKALAEYGGRVKGALTKSLRESKVHSTWAAPDTAYEGAMLAFAETALDPQSFGTFMAAFLPFTERVAKLGADNTLVQTVIKLTVPGVPDIYQGCELWDLSLVDPDNRRPVDFVARKAALEEAGSIVGFLEAWKDARFKMAATRALLRLRQQHAALFTTGSYESVSAVGQHADEVVAFVRRAEDVTLLVVTARFPARRSARGARTDAVLQIPRMLTDTVWHDVLAGRSVNGLEVNELLGAIPAGVFISK